MLLEAVRNSDNNKGSNKRSEIFDRNQPTTNKESTESSIEAVWVVESSGCATTPNNKITSSQNEPTTTTTRMLLSTSGPTKKATTAGHKFRSILAALSFESFTENHDHNNNNITTTAADGSSESNNKKRLLHRQRRRRKDHNRNSQPKQTTTTNGTHVIRVECGGGDGTSSSSINPSAGCDDVFFDALEFGDASGNQDDFRKEIKPRESIVLSGVSIRSGIGRSSSELHHHTTIETVLLVGGRQDGDNSYDDDDDDDDDATSSPSSEEEEYTKEDEGSSSTRPARGPPPPAELPLRFLRAGKNDPMEGLRRYESTLKMRAEQNLDTILREPNFAFAAIKKHYPHYCHGKGKLGEPCFYEQPPRTNLKALQQVGVTVEKLMRHYTMVTEYQWQYLDRDDLSKSIYIIDLAGIRMTDFAGEAVEFLKKASKFSAEHYPERAGYVFVINVPAWFKIIWTVVKPIIDESTLKKIYILRGKDEIRQNMLERIPLENIPPEYGGTSMPLGESAEEKTLAEWMEHNNALARAGQKACIGTCRFCDWSPARSY